MKGGGDSSNHLIQTISFADGETEGKRSETTGPGSHTKQAMKPGPASTLSVPPTL